MISCPAVSDKELFHIEAEPTLGAVRENGEMIEKREVKEETMISIACCPIMAKWRCCCITEGTISATPPDCSTVISVTDRPCDIQTHGCPKTEI